MSQKVGPDDQQELLGFEDGFDALPPKPDFRGSDETTAGHDHANDHYALVYDTDEELYASVVPFVRQGIERGEQCIYVVDERSEELAEIVEALRDGGVDVDDARESGALAFYTVQETYLRTEPFDPEEMISFYADTIDESLDEYAGLRVVAGMRWIDDISIETFMEYEGRVNALFEETDSMALCHYDRDQLSPEVIQDVIRTHPHLIYDDTVCRNFYYVPPTELFDSDERGNDVDRMLGTLRDRSRANTELENRQRYLRAQHEIIASPDRSFEEKLQALFDLGCDRFDLELGAIARVDTDDDRFVVEYVGDDHEHFEPGVELPLSETYCTAATEIKAAGSVTDPRAEGYDDIAVYEEFGIRAYLGTYIEVDGGSDRTFFFVTAESRDDDFSDDERAFLRLMSQWVKYELERRNRERFLRECYEITSDPGRSFEEKLERLLDLGRNWFDLEMAALSQLPSWGGKFRLEKGVGLGVEPEDGPLLTDPGEGCYCRQTITEDAPVGRVDVRDTEWANDSIYEEFRLTSYLGTKVSSGTTPYGTLWFGSTDPRERQFTGTERTFIELMGQWVSYEIERREHRRFQRELYEIAADTDRPFDEKLQALFDLGCERFDLDLGGLARIEPAMDLWTVEAVSGDHEHLEPGARAELSETYCRALEFEETADITDPVDDGFDGTLAYEEFGVKSYLGTRLFLDNGYDRTLFFVSSDPRTAEFSAADRTFLHLMGQWVEYELGHQHHERELEETIDQLQQSNDRLKQFAYAASHDLQEPLRMVSSYLQLLENRYGDELDGDAQDYIDFAVDGADRMRAMVEALLAYSRVEQAVGEFEPVDCETVLALVEDDLQLQIEENDAEITVGSLPTVSADREQLEQLFSNLVSNAVKYNDSDPPRVEITAEERPDHWEFSVDDNGIGIDPDKTDEVFEVFQRLHNDDEYSGTGVGLSLCQEIVDNHDGDIWVETDREDGSTFHFTIPE